MKKVEFQNGAKIIVSHVSEKRMVTQGHDGLSHGQTKEGIGQGISFMSFIPLHLNALERIPTTIERAKSWIGGDAELLSTEAWYERGNCQDGGYYDNMGFWKNKISTGTFVWCPSPASADMVLEEICKFFHKRPTSVHVFI